MSIESSSIWWNLLGQSVLGPWTFWKFFNEKFNLVVKGFFHFSVLEILVTCGLEEQTSPAAMLGKHTLLDIIYFF